MDKLKYEVEKFEEKLKDYPLLQKLEDDTGIKKAYIVLGASAVLLLILFFGFGAGLICNLVGFIYPAYCSFKAIESKMKDEETQWLIYWVVYAIFTLLENFVDLVLYWLPFYYSFKMAFLVWLMLPSTQGASFIYNSFLKDALKNAEEKLEQVVRDSEKSKKKD
mmetsp:Transcript_21547/g.28281  ORF Transcript_21547/g.28281 Transcript_21547/m.28281 type:complete len:164 (-) Transcript_21547:405-896(-)